MLTITKYYEIWDEAAIDAGQSDDTGIEFEDREVGLSELCNRLRGYEPSDSRFGARTWFTSCDDDIDFRTGERTTYSIHLKINGKPLTAHQVQRIARVAGFKVR